MTDLFEARDIKPMLIGEESEPFDSPDYIYELKLDGERCIAYLDSDTTELRNKRNQKMLSKVPELSRLHVHINKRCILDGELAIIKDGKPDFFEIQRRSLMSNPIKIELASKKFPACFTAFDILYFDNHPVNDLPLTERKKLLQSVVVNESAQFAVSRFIEQNGVAFYELAKAQNLEGIVAKRKDSRYYFDKRTKDWTKIKFLKDDDFVICGYIRKEEGVTSILLGQYREGVLTDKGHVTLGVGSEAMVKIAALPRSEAPLYESKSDNSNVVWVTPQLVCTVRYMMKTRTGGLRQPVFKGLRDDKEPGECVEK